VITHEIKKPVQTYIQSLAQRTRDTLSLVRSQHGTPSETTAPDAGRYMTKSNEYMGKTEYARWLETSIRPVFGVGKLVSVVGYPFIPNRIPVPLYKVCELQEIHWMAPVEPSHQHQPRCVGVRSYSHPESGLLWYPPCLLRPLQKEEMELVHLRDQEDPNESS
jgi:hypothetical protein